MLARLALRSSVNVLACAAALTVANPAVADDGEDPSSRITRIGLGPNIYPSYPGSDAFDAGPLIEFSRKDAGRTFEFEAPDESVDYALIKIDRLSFGPVINWEGKRSARDAGANLPGIKFSIEPGAFVGFQVNESFYLRAEVRKGITGHKGWAAMAGADFVTRDGDDWLFSIGPRVTWSDNRYQSAWFGVTAATSLASGLPAYDPGGGVQAYGATASLLAQLGPRWGILSYAKYDRMTGDPARSPVTRRLGSRDQFSGGLALTYLIGEGVD